MIENITLSIPQLIVESVDIWPTINKQVPAALKLFFDPSFLQNQSRKFAAQHAAVNEQLRSLYLSHVRNSARRQNEYYYPLDADHYGERKKIASITLDLQQLTNELLRVMFAIDFLFEYDDWPPHPSLRETLASLKDNPRLQVALEPHQAFLTDLDAICQSHALFSVHPNREVPILEDEPVTILRDSAQLDSNAFDRLLLGDLVQRYNHFFRTIWDALKSRVPEWYAFGVNELPEPPFLLNITIPQLSARAGGIKYGDVDFMHYLHSSPYYGNLGHKLTDLNDRHLYMNGLLQDIYLLHTLEKCHMTDTARFSLHEKYTNILFATETLLYWMRKNIDGLIGFYYYLHYLQTEGREPKKLVVERIGTLLNNEKAASLRPYFTAHLPGLRRINDITNTHKHSFLTSETHLLIGKDQPTVNCLDMHGNSIEMAPTFHSYFLKDIVSDYDAFFVHIRSLIQTFRWPDAMNANIIDHNRQNHSAQQ